MRLLTAIFSLLVLLALACGNSRPVQAPRTATAVRVIMPTSEPTLTTALVATEAPTEAAAPTSLPAAAPVPEFEVLAQTETDRFVVVDPSLSQDKAALKDIGHTLCAGQMVCVVLFWDDSSKAATEFPMTDAQVADEVAAYNLNTSTGLDRLLICKAGSCEE